MKTLDTRFPLTKKTRRDKAEYAKHLQNILTSHSFARAFSQQKSGRKITDLSAKRLAAIIESQYKPGTFETRTDEFVEDIAPDALILEDFKQFWQESMLHIDPKYKLDLSVRAIQGHAQMGHTVFQSQSSQARGFDNIRESYPNTSTLDVLHALKNAKKRRDGIVEDLPSNMKAFSPRYFGRRTQKSIDTFVDLIDRFFEYPQEFKDDVYLTVGKNQPLFGLDFLVDQPINFSEFLRGLYFSLHMDGEKRKDVQNKYGLTMGWGNHHIVDKDAFAAYGLNLCEVASIEYTDELKVLEQLSHVKRMETLETLGVTNDSPLDPKMIAMMRKLPNFSWGLLKETFGVERFENNMENDVFSNVYFREQKGLGISDDLAIIQAGLLPHTFRTREYRETGTELVSRIVGAFVGDHIDTIHTDASYIFTGGQDELLLHYLDAKWKNAMADPDFVDSVCINRSAKDTSLIPSRVLDDFIAMGANYEFGKKGDYDVIHSSQRWFFRKIDDTNAIGEYMKLIRDGISHYELNQQPFEHTPSGELRKNIKVTFDRIHMGPIANEFYDRSNVLLDPKRTQTTVKKYVQSRMHQPKNNSRSKRK